MTRATCTFAAAVLLIVFADQSGTQASTPHSTILHIFTGGDGADPRDPLVDLGGVLYGTTPHGSPFGVTGGCGTIFSITRGGTFTSLYSFLGRGDGCGPQRLVRGPDGLLYGTTAQQTASAIIWGTFFRITPSGEFATLYVFRRNADGYAPGPLVLAADGFFYGVTGTGGANGLGTAFRLSTDGQLTVLRAFQATDPINANERPLGPLVLGGDGNLYGSTGKRLFRMTPSGDLAQFGSPFASSAIIAGRDGRLYGGASAPRVGSALFTVSPSGDFAFGPFDLEGADFRVQFQRRDGTLFGITNPEFFVWKGVAHLTSRGISLAPNSFQASVEPPPIFQRFYRHTSLIDGEDGAMYATTEFDYGFGTIVRFAFGRPAPLDFEGVGRSNRVFWRPGGIWYSRERGNPVRTFGATGDTPVPGDYDGDGRQDLAVFRPGEGGWYIAPSSSGASPFGAYWGEASDRPVPADYDGDGRTDIAVFRPSTGDWYVIPLSTRVPFALHWGSNGDIPVPGDYDGDGIADFAVYRPSNGGWYIRTSTGGSIAVAWGAGRDIPVPGDFDGDGKTDIAVFRPDDGTWYVLFQSGGAIAVPWGAAGDVPISGDFDGDGRFDFVVYRAADNLWYERYASGGLNTVDFKSVPITPADVPITNRP